MSNNLKCLKQQSMDLYLQYRCEYITLDAYLQQIKTLDKEIDKLELHIFRRYLGDNPVFEISTLKQLH